MYPVIYMYVCVSVLSESVAKALGLTGGDEVKKSAHLAEMIDKFFDCVNILSRLPGINARHFKTLTGLQLTQN